MKYEASGVGCSTPGNNAPIIPPMEGVYKHSSPPVYGGVVWRKSPRWVQWQIMRLKPFAPQFSEEEFHALVKEALDSLPDFFKQKLSNVEVLVADWPSPAELRAAGARSRYELLGLYQGIPLTHRAGNYTMVLPDKITIYRMPIERICHTRQAIIRQVRRTVLHELAHHFGLSDDRLRELGAY